MFDADRPILSSAQDRLDRTTFAKYLARCILDHNIPESLVIGLYGTWGSGKTSVINLTLEELHYAANNMLDDEKPIILNFSPWSYSGQNQLIYSFFRRLSSELRRSPFLKNSEKIIHLLELYVSFFTNKPVPKPLRPKRSWLKHIFNHTKTTEDVFAWESGRDLTQVKAELNELLKQQKHKIIIIIDNISRIDNSEIKQIFQIVKSMGDYANTVYLLALDKTQVIHALDTIHEGEGSQYLEKLVQLPFEIPPISKQDLENILVDKLKKIVVTLKEGSWDKEYWGDIYYSTLKNMFDNCRDITRYVNTLSFGFSRVQDVVNPVDFFAISALYTFSPQVYYGIRDNKDLFTDLMTHVYQPSQQKIAEDKARCDEVIHRPGRISHELLLQLLVRLFPRLRGLYQSHVPFFHSESLARKKLRICSPDVFDIYFRLSMPTGNIPEAEMRAILSIVNDPEGFSLALLRLNQDWKILKFLDELDSHLATEVSTDDAPTVINALMDSTDLFPEGENTLLSFDTPMRVHRILHQLLRRFDTSEKRFVIYRDAITHATNSLYIIVHELNLQNAQHIESEDTILPLEQRDFSISELEMLKKLAVAKIIKWAEMGRLGEHPKLLPILYAWKNWGNAEEVSRYVGHLIQEQRGLLNFLGAALQVPVEQAMTKLSKNPEWEKYLENVSAFISLESVEPYAKALFEESVFETLREKEQLAVLIFLDLIGVATNKKI